MAVKKSKAVDIATINHSKFHTWVETKFPKRPPCERVGVGQSNNLIHLIVFYCWQYGQLTEFTPLCQIPMYPVFQEDFNPDTFYANCDFSKDSFTTEMQESYRLQLDMGVDFNRDKKLP